MTSVILAVSSSNLLGETPASVALRCGDTIRAAQATKAQRTDLAELTRQLCVDAAVHAADITEIRIDRGPGSYIGLRIAVTFARFLASFNGARLLCTDSLLLTAASTWATSARPQQSARVWLAVDGRARKLHAGSFDLAGDEIRPTSEPAAIGPEQLAAVMCPEDLLIASQAIAQTCGIDEDRRLEPVTASAEILLQDRLELSEVSPDALEPIYLMGSYVS